MQNFDYRIGHHVPLIMGSVMLWLQDHAAGLIGALSIVYGLYSQYHDRQLREEENRLKREELDLMRQEAEYRRRADRP